MERVSPRDHDLQPRGMLMVAVYRFSSSSGTQVIALSTKVGSRVMVAAVRAGHGIAGVQMASTQSCGKDVKAEDETCARGTGADEVDRCGELKGRIDTLESEGLREFGSRLAGIDVPKLPLPRLSPVHMCASLHSVSSGRSCWSC